MISLPRQAAEEGGEKFVPRRRGVDVLNGRDIREGGDDDGSTEHSGSRIGPLERSRGAQHSLPR